MRFYPKIIIGLLALMGTACFATNKHIPIPATNANQTFSSLSALETAVAAFASNFSAARSTYGVPTGEPVLQLDAGSYGDLNWSNYSLSSRITVRGSGPYSHDGYAPTAGSKIGTLRVTNCTNIRFMGLEAEPSSIATTEGNGVYGNSNHRIDASDNIEFVRCAINGDIARSTAALSTVPPNGVQALILARNSDDCKVMHCSLMGARETCIGLKASGNGASAAANDWEVRGNVMAQSHNDGFVKLGGRTMDNWIFADNLGIGKGRASAGQHRDIIQITGTSGNVASAVGWVLEGNWSQSFDAWGNDNYMAKQGFWWGAEAYNTNSEAVIQDNFFGLPGKHIAGKHTGSTVQFNTGFIPLDTLGSDTQGNADTYTANYAAASSWGSGPSSYDENIFPYKNGSSAHPWTGANGAAMYSNDFNQAEHSGSATFDWDVMGAFLANYDDTYSQTMVADYDNSDTDSNNGKYQVVPREASIGKGVSPDIGIEMYKPATGSRAHWDHANPTGCYQLFERVFDEDDHDNWKDWGWPVAVTAHLYYDPNNAMGGASGDYDSFDANGDVSGGGGDTTAPSVPTGLASGNVTTTSVDLSWNASTDNVAVTGYKVYTNGSNPVSVTSGTSTTISGLTQNTSYTFTVSAYDAASNESSQSSGENVTTADGQAPTTPTGLTSSNVTSTTADLDWNASTDNVGVTGYKIYTGGSNPADVGNVTSVTMSGLSASTSYAFTVSAYDAASNESSQSSAENVTTSAGGGSTVISEDFSVSAANFTEVAGGTWSVSSGRYVLTSPASGGSGLLGNIAVHDTVLTGDYTVSATVRITGTGGDWDDAALVFGYQDSSNFYYVSLNESNDGNTKGVFKVVNGTPTQMVDITVSIASDTDYTVEVVRTGSSIVVNLNSTQIASTTDSTFSGGQVGFGSKNDGAEFDDLSVDGTAASATYAVYQSEDATLSDVVVNTGQTGYTGTGFVDYPYDGGGYVEYSVNAAGGAGDYLLSVRYANGDSTSRYLTRTVNGSGSTSVEWPATGAWNSWSLLDDVVTLSSGSNAIRFTGPGSQPGGANPDKMTVYHPDVYQAEDATLSNVSVNTGQTGYTGTGFIDYPYDGSGYVEYTVNVATAGDYLISVRYANGDSISRYLTRTVNGSGSTSVEWPVTGAWNSWVLLNDTVTLSAGSNTIRFTGPGSQPGGANPDKMTVYGPLQ